MARTDFDRKTFALVGNGDHLHLAIDGIPLCGHYVSGGVEASYRLLPHTGFRMPTCRGCQWGLCEMILGRQMDSAVWGKNSEALIQVLMDARTEMRKVFQP